MLRKEIGIGLLGLGNVGTGVVRGLARTGGLIGDRSGVRLVIRAIAVRDTSKPRDSTVDLSLLTTDAVAVVEDPSVDVVVEMIGGTTHARDLVLAAFRKGKPVVTANKALLAECGDQIFPEAEAHGVDLYFESSVGGGIPIIRSLREGLIGNHIRSMHGILNGTCNYILTRMAAESLSLEPILAEAQASGYAEAEPSLDVDGWDTAHKAVILASLAYGFTAGMDDVEVEGIRHVELRDLQSADAMGYTIKLLASIQHVDAGISIRVQPTLVPKHNLLASVSGVFNAVLVDGDLVGETVYFGKGAGSDPTASAVLSDLVDVGRNLVSGSARRVPALARYHQYAGLDNKDVLPARYYLRVSLLDEPGKLAQVAQVLGQHQISLALVQQQAGTASGFATVVIVTHLAREGQFREAIAELDALEEVGAPTVKYRIEDFTTPECLEPGVE